MKNVVEERGGDLRAYEGTDADLEIQMDRPLNNGLLVVNDQQQLQLAGGEGNVYKGTVHIDKDGQYHVAAMDNGQQVRLSDDFFIEARKAESPEIRVSRARTRLPRQPHRRGHHCGRRGRRFPDQ